MRHIYQNAWLKARLLEGRTVGFTDRVPDSIFKKINFENHHHDEWIFIKLNNSSRVRLVVDQNPCFMIDVDKQDNLILIDQNTNEVLIKSIMFEEAIVHAPDQLFLGLYEYCRIGCKFCPLSTAQDEFIHYSLDSIYKDIADSSDKKIKSIGITTAVPYHLSSEDIADEMIFIVSKIREKVGSNIPIGVSTRIPSETKLLLLKEVGASEARLNIEVPNLELSKKLMPNKAMAEVFNSIELACKIFGRGKVSSNIILGLGETDSDVIACIEHLAKVGAIATLYPYDSFDSEPNCEMQFHRPSAERLYNLAVAHKDILKKYNLDPCALLTMCPACAASHIFPGKDL